MKNGTIILIALMCLVVGLVIYRPIPTNLGSSFVRPANVFSSVATSGIVLLGPAASVNHGYGKALTAHSNRAWASLSNNCGVSLKLCFASTCSNTSGINFASSTVYEINSLNLYSGNVTVYAAATSTKCLTIQESTY